MKKYLAPFAVIVALSQPAAATTFPSLTTIYVGSGVTDSGGGISVGVATMVSCTNVSGKNATIRFLVLNANGTAANPGGSLGIPHGVTRTVATHDAEVAVEHLVLASGTVIKHGSILVEATESAIFCTAAVIDAAGSTPAFALPLHLVRVTAPGHGGVALREKGEAA